MQKIFRSIRAARAKAARRRERAKRLARPLNHPVAGFALSPRVSLDQILRATALITLTLLSLEPALQKSRGPAEAPDAPAASSEAANAAPSGAESPGRR